MKITDANQLDRLFRGVAIDPRGSNFCGAGQGA